MLLKDMQMLLHRLKITDPNMMKPNNYAPVEDLIDTIRKKRFAFKLKTADMQKKLQSGAMS